MLLTPKWGAEYLVADYIGPHLSVVDVVDLFVKGFGDDTGDLAAHVGFYFREDCLVGERVHYLNIIEW